MRTRLIASLMAIISALLLGGAAAIMPIAGVSAHQPSVQINSNSCVTQNGTPNITVNTNQGVDVTCTTGITAWGHNNVFTVEDILGGSPLPAVSNVAVYNSNGTPVLYQVQGPDQRTITFYATPGDALTIVTTYTYHTPGTYYVTQFVPNGNGGGGDWLSVVTIHVVAPAPPAQIPSVTPGFTTGWQPLPYSGGSYRANGAPATCGSTGQQC